MRREIFYLVVISLLFFHYISTSQGITYIKNAVLIDPANEVSVENAGVLVKGDKILKAGKLSIMKDIPENADVVDVSGKYVIPGLVDGHIHFFQSGGLYTRPDALDLRHRVPYDEEIKWIRENIDDVFKRNLACGITGIVDVGGPFWNFDVRSQAEKQVLAPEVYVTGPLLTPYVPDAFKIGGSAFTLVLTKEDARREVQKQLKYDPDFIKIWYIVGRGVTAEEYLPTAKTIVEESHKAGKPVYVHATELETAKKAIEAGCDVLVHMVRDQDVDEEFLRMAKENEVVIMPTLWVFHSYTSVYSKKLALSKKEHLLGNPYVIGTFFDMYELSEDELGERQKRLLAKKGPVETNKTLLKNLKKVYDYGITVAAGTDAGNVGVLHGPGLFHEFDYMSDAGLSAMEILKSATINAAKMLENEERFGTIEKNKHADLVVLNSNPLEDIKNVSDIHLVMKSGKFFKPGNIIQPSPKDLAQIQLNAYNEKDIESFLSVYADDVEIYEFPSNLLYTGKEKMRETYTEYFKKAGELHCELVDRIVLNNKVIDREKVTTEIPGREEIHAIAVYEIADGRIQKVWFMR